MCINKKETKVNAEDFIITILGLIFVGAIFVGLFQIMWEESPVMMISCITIGLLISWLNGDWDTE